MSVTVDTRIVSPIPRRKVCPKVHPFSPPPSSQLRRSVTRAAQSPNRPRARPLASTTSPWDNRPSPSSTSRRTTTVWCRRARLSPSSAVATTDSYRPGLTRHGEPDEVSLRFRSDRPRRGADLVEQRDGQQLRADAELCLQHLLA